MNELALFAGIGGGILGSKLIGWQTVCAVEKEPYCREVLLRRQRDGVLPVFPIWDDVRTFDGRPWRGAVDIITAGFPCQPFSVAGKRRGEADERNMWPDTIRILREIRPRYALLENVPGLLATRYFGRILGDISESGYNAEWKIVAASEVGAPHIRKRLWILLSDADRPAGGFQQIPWSWCEGSALLNHDGEQKHVANSKGKRCERGKIVNSMCLSTRRSGKGHTSGESEHNGGAWSIEPDVGRVANGISNRVDRLKGLGNAQVPAVVKRAWEVLR